MNTDVTEETSENIYVKTHRKRGKEASECSGYGVAPTQRVKQTQEPVPPEEQKIKQNQKQPHQKQAPVQKWQQATEG